MDAPMTKAKLLELLQTNRAELDALIAEIPVERLSEPNVIDGWAIKDHLTHLTYYEAWLADRIAEVLQGISYKPTAMDAMTYQERNPIVYEQHRNDSTDQVLAAWKAAHAKLMQGVTAQSEEFLTTPQVFEGAPGPMLVWQMLEGDVYGHYQEHIGWIRGWWAKQK